MKNKRRDLKFLWHTNALYTQSGYATESRDILTRLKKDRWDFAVVANHGVESQSVDIMDIKHYPRMGDPNGSDAILHHAINFGAHVVFTMLDIWIIQVQYLQELRKQNIKWIPWVPIDQIPVNPGVVQNLKEAYQILSFSKFGQETLEDEGFASNLIIEGIDTDIFKPMDQGQMRKKLGIPEDIFLFGMIGANKENPPRKGYQEALEGFAMFSKDHPEARIFFHCQQLNPQGGFPILPYAQYLGIADKVLNLDQYTASYGADSNKIAEEISSFDVLLHPSQTEGFGLLSVEAQSCGVPVIVNGCTSMPELVIEGETGWITETERPWWRNGGGYVWPAKPESIHEKMEDLYKQLQDDKRKKQISKSCRENILKNYNIDDIVKNRWIPYLEDLQEEVLGTNN